jgi:hypothetical protein
VVATLPIADVNFLKLFFVINHQQSLVFFCDSQNTIAEPPLISRVAINFDIIFKNVT